ISFKASLLMDQAQGDPIKKAEIIRDMMHSLAKIPDPIRQELYLKEITRIMDISEEVLYSTLAQIQAKGQTDQARTRKKQTEKQAFQVVKDQPETRVKVDPQYEIERHLISLLLRYGEKKGKFEDYILKADEEGELKLEAVNQEAKVFEKIYMDLQEDEIEFTNDIFKSIYSRFINEFQTKITLVIV